MIHRSSLLLSVTLAVAPAAVGAQGRVPVLTPQPAAVFAKPFSRLAGLRELTDGRLLIADRTEQIVAYLDFARGTIDRIGRDGQGPGEYQSPTGLFALPGGETLLSDLGNMRMTVIDEGGKLGETHPILRQGGPQGLLLVRPEGTDDEGRIYFANQGVTVAPRGSAEAAADSAPVLRGRPADTVFDTVAMLTLPPRTEEGPPIRLQGGGSFQIPGNLPKPYAPRDEWAVAPNGDVIVARANGYRVDRYTADGRIHRGTEVAYEPVRITRAVKEAWADRLSQRTASFQVGGGGRGRTIRLQAPDIDEVDFPEFMPPFVDDAVFVAPDGEVWVVRASEPDSPRLYDVFNLSGRLTKQIRLPANRQLLALGEKSAYVVSVDDDDLQWLERYARP